MTYIPEALRRLVVERANGCCEYCLLHQGDNLFPHEVDHIIAEKHRGQTVSNNLSYACLDCNRHKGSDVSSVDPETEEIVRLFNPRRDKWSDHFRLDGAYIQPLTPIGHVTEFLLQMNSLEQVEKRAGLIELGRYPCLPIGS